jgi:hypothetical protein
LSHFFSLARLLAVVPVLVLAQCDKPSARSEAPADDSSHPAAATAASSSSASASPHGSPYSSTAASSPASPSSSPSTAAAPDPAALLREAHSRYGEDKEAAVEAPSFVVVSYEPNHALLEAARALLRKGIANYSQGWFGPMPREPVYVVLFSTPRAFDAFSREQYQMPGSENPGLYSHHRREIVVDGSAGERALPALLHEMLHPVLEQSWETAVGHGKEIPHWLNECVASTYESPRWDDAGGLHGAKQSMRLPLLQGALADAAKKKGTQVDALFGMGDSEFLGDDPSEPVELMLRDPDGAKKRRIARGKLHSAVARYLCVWLENREPSLLAPFYREARDGFAKDPTGRTAFEKVVGKPPGAIQSDWEAWIAAKP